MQDPIIVMGMHKSGTTLVAEMIHRGGTPMMRGEGDFSYDSGTKYERAITQKINLRLLNARPNTNYLPALMPIWNWELNAFPADLLPELAVDAGDGIWGFKDPRTTVTYPAWAAQFPTGARFYVYRSHREFLRRCFKRSGAKSRRVWRARREFNAWFAYNECILRNVKLDEMAGRAHVVLRYEELMNAPELVELAAQKSGVSLFDARDFSMRRTRDDKPKSRLETLYLWAGELGNRNRLNELLARLGEIRVTPSSTN
jgi:hypothetical protein